MHGWLVLITALVGIVVNVLATWMISRADRTSLNVEGAYQHILNDLFAFIATAVAGLIIVLTGWVQADVVATLIVVALMIKAGIGLIKASAGSSSRPPRVASMWQPSIVTCTTYRACSTYMIFMSGR